MIFAVTIICTFFSRAGGQYKDGLLLDPATIVASIYAGNMDVVRYLIAAVEKVD